ncbi:transposase [Streptomyces sp. NPDC058280]|uniref:transposase n=1 Tax=Streptomyces sp. NPDC058280 TaxID=3346419 RepID=UPI0036E5AFD5
MLCENGPVTSPVDLTLLAEHRRGHGSLYDALNSGRIAAARLRRTLAALPQPKAADGRLVLAVDVTNWLRPNAPTSPDRLFCHTYGRGKNQHIMIPGWPYSIVAALESGRTSWCQLLDAVRLGPEDDLAEATARQVRRFVENLITGGQWCEGEANIFVVFDAGYDAPRIAHLLDGLPVEVLGRLRSDCVMRKPVCPVPGSRHLRAAGRPSTARSSASPSRTPGTSRTPRLRRSPTATEPCGRWPGTVSTPASRPARPGSPMTVNYPSSRARCSGFRSTTCPETASLGQSGCGPRKPVCRARTSICAGRGSLGASTWSPPSACSSRRSAGPARRSAPPRPRTAGPGS